MQQTRRQLFETNSSSTHAFVFKKKPDYQAPKTIHFGFVEISGPYDACFRDTKQKADYLWTLTCDEKNWQELRHKILDFLPGVEVTFEEPVFRDCGSYSMLVNGEVSSGEGIFVSDLLDFVYASRENLLNFLCDPESLVLIDDDCSSDLNLYNFLDRCPPGKFIIGGDV